MKLRVAIVLFVTLTVSLQLASDCAHINFTSNGNTAGIPFALTGVAGSSSPLGSIINKNLQRQLMLVIQLSDISAGMARSAIPSTPKGGSTRDKRHFCLLPSTSSDNNRCMMLPAVVLCPLPGPLPAVMTLGFVLFAAFFIRRPAGYIYHCLLPRSGIDDHILIIRLFFHYAHRLNVDEFFILQGGSRD